MHQYAERVLHSQNHKIKSHIGIMLIVDIAHCSLLYHEYRVIVVVVPSFVTNRGLLPRQDTFLNPKTSIYDLMRDASLLVDLFVTRGIERKCFVAGKRDQPTP